ncbi:MAG: hypothetical protein QJR01_03470 [Kyrpidia sp.]|nr:hypothetical protein [Kyrpidia sp.]
MREERMMILRMMENGQITAEEAERLLLALGETVKEDLRQGGSRFRAWELGPVWQDAARNMRDLGKQVSEKMARELQQAMESLAALPEWFGRWEIGGAVVEQVYRAPSPVRALEIRTLHGNVRVLAERREDLEVHVRAQVADGAWTGDGNPLDDCWHAGDGTVSFTIDENVKSVRGAHVTVRVPDAPLERVAVHQTNGRIRVELVEARILELSTTNGTVEMEQVVPASDGRVEARVTNGRISWVVPKGSALDGTLKTGIGVADVHLPSRLAEGSRIVRRRGEIALRAPQGVPACEVEMDLRAGRLELTEV